ncbi:MAG: hypothetical protein ACOC5E_01805 [Acidobacteriota bacterium]
MAPGTRRPVYSPAPDRVQSFGLSDDGRLMYVAVQISEADVWMASLQ